MLIVKYFDSVIFVCVVVSGFKEIFKNKNTVRLPLVILAVSVLVTIGVTYSFYQTAKSKDTTRFYNEVNRIQSAVENKINLYIALLKGGRGFIESTDKLNREIFANYVNNLGLDENFAGIQGIGYSKVFQPDERESLIVRMKSEGYSDFELFPETNLDSHQAVIYIEPLTERNRKVVGFDMSSEKNRREAIYRARDSGQAAASAKINLIQEDEKDNQVGFLIYLPIYKRGSSPSSVKARRQNLTGFVYSPFRAGDFLREIQANTLTRDIAFKIYDGEISPENLLTQTAQPDFSNFTDQIEKAYTDKENLEVAGRNWVIEYTSLPEFTGQSNVGWTPLIFLSGVAFSILMFGLTYWEASARVKMQAAAAELYKLEQQKQLLLEKEQKARQSAEQANKAKDEFIAVVSHELRTPLNAIAGWAKILKTDSLSSNTKNLALDKVDKNLRLQTQLVEELLDYTQVISEGIISEGRKFVFSEVFERTCIQFEEQAKAKDIEFVRENKLNGHKILGDENRIQIVIQNLFSNAVKFTGKGGKIEALILEQNDYIQLVVKDNGKGIKPDFLPHIFDRFRQDDNTSTRVHGGLGLGLAITNHIIKLHNGIIEVQSEGEGKGSTFTVKIPYIEN